MELIFPVLEAQSLNYWANRGVPQIIFFFLKKGGKRDKENKIKRYKNKEIKRIKN